MRGRSLFGELLRTEAREWGIGPRVAGVLFLLPFVGGLALAATRLHKPLFRFLTAEDSVLEWLQFSGYLLAAVVAALIGRTLWRSGQRLASVVFGGLALSCLFVAGEEISWGQRLFSLQTPDSLAAVNKQDEITLHNVEFVQRIFNLALLFVGFLGSFSVWLTRWAAGDRLRPVANLFLPPTFLTSFFFVLFVYRFLRFSLLPDSSFTVTRMSEWTEFCLATALACFTVLLWRRLRAAPQLPHSLTPGGERGVAVATVSPQSELRGANRPSG